MKIKKTRDGVLWCFDEEIWGWIRFDQSGKSAGEILIELIDDKIQADRELTYSQALREVLRENFELAEEYSLEIQAGRKSS